jgi:hypothetical protein
MTVTGPGIVYLLCMTTSVVCAGLLVRGYLRTRTRLLMWSAFAFLFLALNNTLLVTDMLLLPSVDLFVARQASGFAAVAVLLYGFIWEMD